MKKYLISLFFSLLILFSCSTARVYNLHTSIQDEYLSGPYEMATLYAKGTGEDSKPNGVTINWPEKDGPYRVFLSRDALYSDSLKYESVDNFITLYNLLLDETYFVKIVSSEGETIYEENFETSNNPPRLINVEGVTNFRDLGGWMTESGKRAREALIYRSGRLSENNSGQRSITKEGIRAVEEELKIKTEVDLRRVDNNENGGLKASVVEGVEYISLPMKTGGNYLVMNIDILPLLFEILADIDNYPTLFHCSIGTDRTGVVSFILNGLLGVGEEDLYRDYLFSNFANIGVMRGRNTLKNYIAYMDKYQASTLSGRIESFLIDSGVKREDIKAFKEIMLYSGGENE